MSLDTRQEKKKKRGGEGWGQRNMGTGITFNTCT